MAHRFNPKHVEKLVNPDRQKLLPPAEILAPLQIQATDNVADIGCGPGFFTIPAAKFTNGTVYGVDVEPQMLEHLKGQAEAAGVTNIELVQSDAEHISLPDQSIDKVLVAFVLHEVNNLEAALQELSRILRPEGKMLILEWEKKATASGPPVEERLEPLDLEAPLQKMGYQTEILRPNSNNYMVLAKK